jgi:hypothetical protein
MKVTLVPDILEDLFSSDEFFNPRDALHSRFVAPVGSCVRGFIAARNVAN